MTEPAPQSPAPDSPTDTPPPAKSGKWWRFFRRIFLLIGILAFVVLTYSISISLRKADEQETVLIGQNQIASACDSAFRILVRNRITGKPVEGASVELQLSGTTSGKIKLGVFRTDASGSIGDSIQVPDLPPGKYQLIVDSSSSLGNDHLACRIELAHPARILLSTDKPLYQPGQTIHLRSLLLNKRTHKPFANEQVTIEVSDPKGNKVFKETRKTSAYGIAAANFALANELTSGRYAIRAFTGSATAERTVEIKQYVLPKFKIRIATDKSYYLPGQTVSGTLQATYFFGKPVANGNVKFSAATLDATQVGIRELSGQTDADGRWMPAEHDSCPVSRNILWKKLRPHLFTISFPALMAHRGPWLCR